MLFSPNVASQGLVTLKQRGGVESEKILALRGQKHASGYLGLDEAVSPKEPSEGPGFTALENKWSSRETGDSLTWCPALRLACIMGPHEAQTWQAASTDIKPVLRIRFREGQ